MAGVGALLMVTWQACVSDEGGGRRRGQQRGRHGGRATGGGAWGRCRAAPACSALLPVRVKAVVRGSLLCVTEEGNRRKEKKRRKEKE
jgi:hypothetical protein